MFGGKKPDVTESSSRGPAARITTVEKEQDFLDFLAEDDRLAVVKFHAAWCKSCQKFGVKYKKLAMEEGDAVGAGGDVVEWGRVRFAEVEFNTNAKLCKSLGIKRLPSVHMYKGEERLTEFSCAPSKFQMVIDNVNEFVDISQEEIQLKKTLEAGSSLLDGVAVVLQEESNGAKNGEYSAGFHHFFASMQKKSSEAKNVENSVDKA